ncbi:MAG: hypothetical protein AUH46_06815 [Gemmatimonadetes bacterium 13_1_40CM_70_15]|nr:MAG: hypothetical protein AUH46_06815 [Gemmatimonadetes bacterium 13_1_40CM_70_15]
MGLRALPFTAALVLGACSTGRQPAPSTTGPRTLRGYILVVPMRDLLDSTLANLLRRRGFRVWPDVRGGSGPAAALVSFTFRDVSSESGRWLHARFFDTRTGATVAAASVPLDTLPNDARLHAQALVQALLAEPAPSPPP